MKNNVSTMILTTTACVPVRFQLISSLSHFSIFMNDFQSTCEITNTHFYARFIVFISIFILGMILQILCFNIQITDTDPTSKLTYGTRDLALTHPLAIICIITTTTTNKRLESTLEKWGDHPLVKDGTFEINVVANRDSDVETSFPLIKVPCEDDGKTSGTACRTWQTYINFVSKETKANWFYRATDSSWINLDNLRRYISTLHKLYDPKTNVVFKAQSDGMNNITEGDSGWLMSRAFITYHQQNNLSLISLSEKNIELTDNKIETNIINKIYPKQSIWDDGYIVDALCNNCQGDLITNKQWESFPQCKQDQEKQKFGIVKELIAFKITSQPDSNAELAKSLTQAPSSLLYSFSQDRQTISVCYSTTPVSKYSYTEKELRKKIVFVSIIPNEND